MVPRLLELIKAIRDAILRGFAQPYFGLEGTYADLQARAVAVRQELAQAIATQRQLEIQYEKAKAQGKQNRCQEIKTKLDLQREKIRDLRARSSELESEIQQAYVKKQVLIARNKATREASNGPPIDQNLLKQIFIVTCVLIMLCLALGIWSLVAHGR